MEDGIYEKTSYSHINDSNYVLPATSGICSGRKSEREQPIR